MNYYNTFIKKLGTPSNEGKLTEYINFVQSNHISSPEEYTENHHILPKCLFDCEDTFTLLYKDHVKCHLLLASAYPIQEFERPLNFMLSAEEKKDPRYKKILSESRKLSWVEFKKTSKYDEWRKKRSAHCSNEMKNGKSASMTKIRQSKEGYKEEISKHFKDMWSDEEHKKKHIESMVEERNSVEGKKRMKLAAQTTWDNKTDEERNSFNETMKSVNGNKSKRLKNSKTTKEKWKDPEFRAKMAKRKPKPKGGGSDTMKEKWKDPEFRAMMLEKRAEARRKKNETING